MIGFHKMHGLGNCFIFFDEFNQDLSFIKTPEKIKLLCTTSHGLGSDGLIFINPPRDTKHHCRMEMFNTDGSEAEMCGNAIRGTAMLFDRKALGFSPVLIETRSGVKEVSFIKVSDGEAFYRAQMGKASFDLVRSGELVSEEKRKSLVWNSLTFEPLYANVGNPHAVIFMKNMLSLDEMKAAGAWLETHTNHPRRINVEFVDVLSRNEARVHVWERGCGMTAACGTGATAVVAAGIQKGLFDKKVTIHMSGGDLIIEQDENSLMYMTGPVQEVAIGQISAGMAHRLSRA
ncbi:MAG: diaminopimelate epimerase [Candidatus Riflebacteria bacterium]|nr:diaminopimelate epimerase [Candidatus Riflebacteria bacterium]